MSSRRNSMEPKLSWNQLQEAGDPELISHLMSGNDDALVVIIDLSDHFKSGQ